MKSRIVHQFLPSRTNESDSGQRLFRSRFTIRLSPTIRSVATGTQWSGPMKSRIVHQFLPSRATESDCGSGPLTVTRGLISFLSMSFTCRTSETAACHRRATTLGCVLYPAKLRSARTFQGVSGESFCCSNSGAGTTFRMLHLQV